MSTADVLRLTNALTQNEVLEDPNDLVANYLLHWSSQLTGGSLHGAAFFLFSHGIIKLMLVAAVLPGLRGAYPAFIGALILLIAYQCYQISQSFSFGLLAVTILDVIVLTLTVHEYRLRRASAGLAHT